MNLAASSSIGGAGNITINSIVGDGGSGYALTKVGAGTAILAAANTYGGGTTISAGTLEVSGSVAGNVTVSSTSGTALRLDNHTALASSATLTLPNSPAAGAVNLNFSSGQQSIAGLTIGTTSMAQGTWGSNQFKCCPYEHRLHWQRPAQRHLGRRNSLDRHHFDQPQPGLLGLDGQPDGHCQRREFALGHRAVL